MTESDTPADERRRHEAATVTKALIFHRVLLPSAKRNANRPCTTNAATGVTHTYAEHFDEVAHAIGGLRQLGIVAGQILNGTSQTGFEAEQVLLEKDPKALSVLLLSALVGAIAISKPEDER